MVKVDSAEFSNIHYPFHIPKTKSVTFLEVPKRRHLILTSFLPAEVAGIIDPNGNVLIPGVCQGVIRTKHFSWTAWSWSIWLDDVMMWF